jgi:hypothetical protein
MALEPKDQLLVTMAAILEELLDDHISDIGERWTNTAGGWVSDDQRLTHMRNTTRAQVARLRGEEK